LVCLAFDVFICKLGACWDMHQQKEVLVDLEDIVEETGHGGGVEKGRLWLVKHVRDALVWRAWTPVRIHLPR